jgi:hypothetical protein
VINNFNSDAFESLCPKYAGGRPPMFTLPQRQQKVVKTVEEKYIASVRVNGAPTAAA